MERSDEMYSLLTATIDKLSTEGHLTDALQTSLLSKLEVRDFSIEQVYRNYQEHLDLQLMEEELVELASKPARKRPSGVDVSKSPESGEDSSPLDNYLRRKKKQSTEHQQQQQQGHAKSMIQPIKAFEDV
jgi:hypothetical protein